MYRICFLLTLHGIYQSLQIKCIYISDLGDGWAPTILETEEEWEFLREAMGLFVSSYNHFTFIGGSTSAPHYSSFGYSDYRTQDICGTNQYVSK